MNRRFYRVVGNWHKHPWVSKLLCKMGRHDYEFLWMDGDSGILQCFYCEQRRGSHTSLGTCKHCGNELGKEWKCYDEQCREDRREAINKSIAEAEEQGLYEISEHISGSEIG